MNESQLQVVVTWNPLGKIESVFPDDQMTVLLAFDNGEVGPGYREAGRWYHFSGERCMDVVTWWADYPSHPEETLKTIATLQTH